LRGAPVVTTDATLEKSFLLQVDWKFDLRGEFYNLMYHAVFNVPGFTMGAADGRCRARGLRGERGWRRGRVSKGALEEY
jgi:hypothetical protein